MKNCVAIVALMAGLSVGNVLAQAPSAASGAPVASGTWQVDGNHTAAQFSVKHMMVSTVRGTLGKVSGTIEYDGKSANSIKADIAIDVNGINTGDREPRQRPSVGELLRRGEISRRHVQVQARRARPARENSGWWAI